MSLKPLRWGIISSGKICYDFCVALSTLSKEDHIVTHVAARNINKAKEFAANFNIKNYSDNYAKVAEDPNVDVVYIGVVNIKHKELSIMALNHGKPVLCEKPCTMDSKELEEVLKVAKEKNVFYMEAVWTRCFPIYNELTSKLGKGLMGEPNVLIASFGIEGRFDNDEKFWNKDIGGSTLLDIGIYLLTFSDLIFEGYPLLEINACGHVDKVASVERSVGITMTYKGNKIVQLLLDADHNLPNDATIICSKGKIHVEAPFWCATKYTEDCGNVKNECEFPLPVAEKPTNFINSVGLRFEADHVRDCLIKGLKESPLIPHTTSQRIMGYMDEVRQQIGSTYAV